MNTSKVNSMLTRSKLETPNSQSKENKTISIKLNSSFKSSTDAKYTNLSPYKKILAKRDSYPNKISSTLRPVQEFKSVRSSDSKNSINDSCLKKAENLTALNKKEKSNQSSQNPAKEIEKINEPVEVTNLLSDQVLKDTLHYRAERKLRCNSEACCGSLLADPIDSKKLYTIEKMTDQAKDFLKQFYESKKMLESTEYQNRLENIEKSIKQTMNYSLTFEELEFGVRTAWRNSNRCIGRMYWNKLKLFDCCNVETTQEMFENICKHLEYATNDGNIRSAITVFRQKTKSENNFRIWNRQFISYAGYKGLDGKIIGDPISIDLTEICMKLGWKGEGTEFDILPLVLQANGQKPKFYEIPDRYVKQVQLKHPSYESFAQLNLKWYCVPCVSNMMLNIGGIQFTACGFNGWYMGTEIGRNLSDVNRYNKISLICENLKINMDSNVSLWKDQALIELNRAVLYTFQVENVVIMDHHTASASFMKHFESEVNTRGGCPADWVWITPPISGHLCPVFHLEMLNYQLSPAYEYQKNPWEEDPNWENLNKEKIKTTILYASETGTSEAFARHLNEELKQHLDAKIFGIGLGNSSYNKFCEFGKYIDIQLFKLGAIRFNELACADELEDQKKSFENWVSPLKKVS